MVARVMSCEVDGLEAVPVSVELDLAGGTPGLSIVGMGDTAIRESRERVLAALRNSGYELPDRRITVNLAPADLRKEGSRFDLPIALGILGAMRVFSMDRLAGCLVLGELSLTGEVSGREPSFPAALLARRAGLEGVILPRDMAGEASLVDGCLPMPVTSLAEVVEFLRGRRELKAAAAPRVRKPDDIPDLADVRGQAAARRALEVAAAGGHNLLLVGPPGSGKTMLALRLPGILPPLDPEEILEVTAIHSVAGLLASGDGVLTGPPFRAPHHTISPVGLAGGGAVPRPGEVTLAHHGVLFLDEMAEFKRGALEVLRQPMEDGRIVVTRATRSVSFPARFMLVGATNPCPCGYLGHDLRPCVCPPSAVTRYRRRISGPLLDRIDMAVSVRHIPFGELSGKAPSERSPAVRERVLAARRVQAQRGRRGNFVLNSRLTPAHLERLCPLSGEAARFLGKAVERLGMTARGYHRVLRVARTLADLAGKEVPSLEHVAEAVQYRLGEGGKG